MAGQLATILIEGFPDTTEPGRRSINLWASTEVLISRLNRLLDEREELKAAYWELYGDWRAAEAKVQILESQLAALQAEHNDVPENKRNPALVAAIAAAVIAAIAQLTNTVVSEKIKGPAEKVTQQAAKLQSDCNVIINVPQPQASAHLAGSSTFRATATVTSPDEPQP